MFISQVYAISPEVRASLQSTSVLEVTSENKAAVWNLRVGGGLEHIDYLILTLNPSSLETEMKSIIREWLLSGKGIVLPIAVGYSEWLYPGKATDIISPYSSGSGWISGIPVTSSSSGINEGVSEVRIHVSNLRNWRFPTGNSALRPLLVTDDGYILAATSQLGAARVLWLSGYYAGNTVRHWPIVQNPSNLDRADNERFAVNLDQWLAGFPVPRVGGEGQKPNSEVSDTSADVVYLINGDVLTGFLQNEIVGIRTSYASLQFPLDGLSELSFEGSGANTDYMCLRNGDRLSGVIIVDEWRFSLLSGAIVKLDKGKVQKISISARQQ